MGIADTFVTIRPDAAGFRTETDAELRKALADAGVTVKVSANTTTASAAADKLKLKLADLSKRITTNIDVADKPAQAKLLALQAQLLDIGKKVVNPKIDLVGIAATQANLAALDVALDELDRKSAQPEVKVQVDQTRLDSLRTNLDQLGSRVATATAGVNDKDATAKLLSLQARLDEIGAKTANPDISIAGVSRAEADLAAVDAQLDALGAKKVNAKVGIDTSDASSGFTRLIDSLLAVAPIAIPVTATLVGGVGGLLGGIASAGAGVGGIAAVAAPAIDDVKKALQAQTAAQKDATDAAGKGASSQVSSANSIKSAQLSLADAQRNAANSAISSAEAVKNAQQGLTDAERKQATDEITSTEAVKTARQTLTDAISQQSYDQEQSLQTVRSAEQALGQAQQQEVAAQQAITQARVAAKQALQDLSNSLTDAQYSAQQDALNLETAQQQLAATMANPAASQQQREQAQLNAEQAAQALKEQQLQVQRLSDQNKQATKSGIEGSQQVVAAKQAEQQADQNVVDKTQALADARTAAARQQAADAETVAKAQQGVADAQRQASQTAQSDAEAIGKAQQAIGDAVRAQAQQQAQSASSIESAQLSLQNAYVSAGNAATAAGGAGSAASAQLAAAMAKLTPSEKDLLGAWKTFKSEYTDWAHTLEPNVVPVLTGGLSDLATGFGLIGPAIAPASSAIVGLETDAKKALKDPFWTQFFAYIDSQAGPTITTFGHDLGNVGKGFAGLLQAFEPVQIQLESGLENLTKRFANWGAGLQGSSSFNSFLTYIETEGPQVIRVIGQFGQTIADVAKDAAPLAGTELRIVSGILQFVDAEAKAHPKLIEFGVALLTISKTASALKLGSFISTVDTIAGIGGKGLAGVAGPIEKIGSSVAGAIKKISGSEGDLAGTAGKLEAVGATGAEAAGGAGALSKAGDAIAKKFPGVTKLLGGATDVLGGLGGAFGATGLAATGVGAAAVAAAAGLTYLGVKIATAKSGNESYYDSLVKQYDATGNNVTGYNNLKKAADNLKDSSGKLLGQYDLQQKQQQNLQSSTGSLAGATDQTTTSQQKLALQVADTKQKLSDANYALDQNQKKLDAVNKGADYIKSAFSSAGSTMKLTTQQALSLADSLGIKNVAGAFDGSSKSAENNKQKLQNYIAEVKLSHDPQAQLKNDLAQAGSNAATADQQVQGLSGALDILAGKNISAAQADLDFRSQVDGLTATLKSNHDHLSLNTQAGVANRQAIAGAGQAALDAATAYQKQGHTSQQTTTYLEGLEGQLEKTLVKQTGNKKAVDGLLQSLGLLPSQAKTAFSSLDSHVNTTHGDFVNLTNHGKPYSIKVNASGTFLDPTGGPEGSGVARLKGQTQGEFSGGGFTGPGHKYEPAGVVHRGEYVQPDYVVDREGVANMDALRAGRATIVPKGYADGGLVDISTTDNLPSLGKSAQQRLSSHMKTLAKEYASTVLSVGGGAIIAEAEKFLGTPYVWGGNRPGGFDCSGLVQYVLGQLGIHAPRTAAEQQAWATPISKAQARAGDEVFWGRPASHTAFYLGGNKMLEAPQTGDVVKIANLYGQPTFGREQGLGKNAGSLLGGQGTSSAGGAAFSGGSAGANQRIAYGLLPQFGWSQSQMTPLVKLWNKECVTEDTRILTRRGWLQHNEVRVGDETLGYNPQIGRNEWTRVLRIVHYDDAEVWQIGTDRWHAKVTPNHRWWSDHRMNNGRGYIKEASGFRETRELRNGDRLRLSAPADTDGILGLSTTDVAVLGWLQGDGSIRRVERQGTGAGFDGRIYQSKPEQIARIRALLAHVDHTESVVRRCAQTEHVFLLRRGYVTDLIKRSGLDDTTPEAVVLAMSPDQRSSWLAAIIDAEGTRKGGHTVIAQNDGALQDAIRLAVYLEGFRPTVRAVPLRNQPASTVGLARPHVVAAKFREPEILDRQPVWCVTTELGTWTAEQDNQVFLTGNSGWNQYAQNPKSTAYGIAQFLNGTWSSYKYPKTSDPTKQEYDGLQYIGAEYGSPAAAWAHEQAYNWYGTGGRASSGTWGVVGEQGAELVNFHGPADIYSHAKSQQMGMGGVPGYASGGSVRPLGPSTNFTNAKLFEQAGQHLIDVILSSFKGSRAQATIDSATQSIIASIDKDFTKSRATGLVAWTKTVNSQLDRLAAERTTIAGKIAAADSTAAGLTSAGSQFTALTNLGGTAGPADIITALNTKLSYIQQFGANLTKLRQLGYSGAIISQIVAAGPDQGGALAQQLVQAGKSQVSQINAAESAVNKADTALGTQGVNAQYGGNVARGFVGGLQAQERNLEKQMTQLAGVFAKGVGHAFHLKGYAAGGSPTPGDVVRVGERGPELAAFTQPVRIYPTGHPVPGAGIDYDRLGQAIARATGARTAPLIGKAEFHDNTDVALTLNKAAFVAQSLGLTS